jgi:hypothetical protein
VAIVGQETPWARSDRTSSSTAAAAAVRALTSSASRRVLSDPVAAGAISTADAAGMRPSAMPRETPMEPALASLPGRRSRRTGLLALAPRALR